MIIILVIIVILIVATVVLKLFLSSTVPPSYKIQAPDYQKEKLYKVEYDSSLKFMLFRNVSYKQLKKRIVEYTELVPGGKKEYTFKLFGIHEWIVIPLSDNVDYFLFVQLYCWLSDSPITDVMETDSLAYVRSKRNPLKSFYLFLDSSHMGSDTLIGRVDSGQKFYIYMPDWLPDSNHLYEKVILKENVNLPDLRSTDLLKRIGFDTNWLDQIQDRAFTEVTVEISR